ncbi:tetratricopeptide repeat protein [Nocardia sp. NPDC127579]|uniref:tetratricopeptide repeat protein n=1 Tax=Nocardia sp. NPDC127579 TaxID=3345402 RepID=UPI00363A1BCB
MAAALAGPRLVLVIGSQRVGKTRTLFEAVRNHEPTARVLVPARNCLGELLTHTRLADTDDSIVVWLDDLHEYSGAADSLTPGMLTRLTARSGRTAVVATLRTGVYQQLRGDPTLPRETRLLLDHALVIELASTGEDPGEHALAMHTYDLDPALRTQGLGEFLGGGPHLTYQQQEAYRVAAEQKDREDPGWAYRLAAESGDLDAMYELGCRLGAAVNWGEPVTVDSLFGVGTAAVVIDSARLREGESWLRRAAEAGQPEAMARLSAVLSRRGASEEASSWNRRAADAGHPRTMYDLGSALVADGRLSEAEVWFQRAAEVDYRDASFQLADVRYRIGVALVDSGEFAEAERWYRRMDPRDTHGGMRELAWRYHLFGAEHVDRGELDEAKSWYRKAIGTGCARTSAGFGAALFELAAALEASGDSADGESWYREAAEAGSAEGMYKLSSLLAGRGASEAESWLRRAADNHHTRAMSDLGDLLAARYLRDEARAWYEKAAQRGSSEAAAELGIILAHRGKHLEAEVWLGQAAEAGHPTAMFNLSVLLADRGARQEAESWLRKAAAAGVPEAVGRLRAKGWRRWLPG